MASPVAIDTTRGVSASTVRLRTPSGLLLRLRTWLGRPRLDAAIARGLNGSGDPAIALRTTQLLDARHRRRLADRLEQVVDGPVRAHGSSSAAPVDRPAVEKASPVLTDLILLLRSPDAVDARGVALVWQLLTDPGSPLFELEERGASEGERLWRESLAVLEALRRS
jgi:hypothetical protein